MMLRVLVVHRDLKSSQWGHGEGARVGLDDADNDSENSQRRGEDLHYQYLHKEACVLSVGNGAGAARDPDTHPGRYVGKADAQSGGEHAVPGVVHAAVIPVLGQDVARVLGFFDLVGKNDGHDDAVNGGGLAENDAASHTTKSPTIAKPGRQEKGNECF